MFSSLKLQYHDNQVQDKNENVIIKVDPKSGLCEFPIPGDTKKHLLPILIDPEEDAVVPERITEELLGREQLKDFWMPDRLCKVCYGCEDAFTMYRRKHHCKFSQWKMILD